MTTKTATRPAPATAEATTSRALDLSKPVLTIDGLRTVITSEWKRIKATLPAHMMQDRFAALILSQAAKDSGIFKCTGESVLNAIYQAAALGLEINAAIGEAYLIPYKDQSSGHSIATLVPGYKGLVKLAMQSPQVVSVAARLVYEGEDFDVEYGTTPHIRHRPNFDVERVPEKVMFAYAVASLVKGDPEFEVMTRRQLEAIRGESLRKTRGGGPWKTDTEEMYRKTPVRRLSKYLPLTPQLAQAIELADAAETGEVRASRHATAKVVDLNAATEVAMTPECVSGCHVADGVLIHDPDCRHFADGDPA